MINFPLHILIRIIVKEAFNVYGFRVLETPRSEKERDEVKADDQPTENKVQLSLCDTPGHNAKASLTHPAPIIFMKLLVLSS